MLDPVLIAILVELRPANHRLLLLQDSLLKNPAAPVIETDCAQLAAIRRVETCLAYKLLRKLIGDFALWSLAVPIDDNQARIFAVVQNEHYVLGLALLRKNHLHDLKWLLLRKELGACVFFCLV